VLPIHSRTARLLALCCCACRTASSSGDEPAATAERTARADATIPTPHYQIRASLPQECAAPEPALESAATRRIGIEIALQPTGDVQVPADPYYARLVDTHHNVYEATLGGCGAPLAPTLPARGQTAHGWIVFELPRTARAATLLYAPELVGASKTELAIELPR
jgi:hypothetical protein